MTKFLKAKRIAIIFITATAILGGCSSHTQVHTIGKAKRIEVVPLTEQSDTADIETKENSMLYKALEDGFKSEYLVINTYTIRNGYSNAEDFILTHMRYVQKAEKLRELFPLALDSLYKKAGELYPDKVVVHKEDITYPNWAYLAATLKYAEDKQFLLYDIMNISISVDEKGNEVCINVNAQPPHIRDFANARVKEATEEEASNTYLNICYTYAYLKALYDENGEYSQLPYTLPTPNPTATPVPSPTMPQPTATYYNFDQAYKDTLVYPLDVIPDFHDTWGQGRSNNTRLHTGTDMINKEGNNIHSCSDGTVLYKGYDKIPGNYVIVLDDYGYEYHYYHLVEIPPEVKSGDRVKAGDIIAHVGDTGNSDVSHLHITIIDPDGVFINPYQLMRELADRAENG